MGKKKCYICGSEDIVFEMDDKYFCSEWCLKEYIENSEEYSDVDEVKVDTEVHLYCPECGKEVYSCDYCGWEFDEKSVIFCTPYGHFCSEGCYFNYLKDEYVVDLKKEIMKKL